MRCKAVFAAARRMAGFAAAAVLLTVLTTGCAKTDPMEEVNFDLGGTTTTVSSQDGGNAASSGLSWEQDGERDNAFADPDTGNGTTAGTAAPSNGGTTGSSATTATGATTFSYEDDVNWAGGVVPQ